MNVHQLVELRFRGLGEARGDSDTSVVDDEVEAIAVPGLPERQLHFADERVECTHLAGVELKRERFAPELLDLANGGGGIVGPLAIGQDDVHTFAREAQRRVPSEAAATTSDNSNLHVFSWFVCRHFK